MFWRFAVSAILSVPFLSAQPHLEKEAVLGQALAEAVLRKTVPVDAASARDYAGRLADRLAPHLPPTGHPYRVAIVAHGDTPYEPKALPGGFVFVPAQLFLEAADAHEFAAMLAHAMAHVAARHGMSPAPAPDAVPKPMVYLGEIPGGMEAYEREADLLAVIALSAAGFDAGALSRYLERVRPDDARVARRINLLSGRPTRRPEPAVDDFVAARDAVRAALPPPPVRQPPSLYR
ncbi:MAG: M48 family metalloprotease [Bryobacterales bacterium]|nr:M48 family metalloprotease [Bryobacterales bacterium]